LIDGEIPVFGDSLSNRVLISKKLSDDLSFAVNDTVGAYFVRNQPVKSNFIISGIYETGLEEFDKKIVMGDLRYVQRLNDWGIHALIEINDTLVDQGVLVLKANVTGGNGNYRYDWGHGFETYSSRGFCPTKDTTIRLIAADYWSNLNAPMGETTLPDTTYIKITVEGNPYAP
jgi:lipoprotein-releasing system permease protein